MRNLLYDKLMEAGETYGFDERCRYWLDTDTNSLLMSFNGEKIFDIFDHKGRVVAELCVRLEGFEGIRIITRYEYSDDDDNEIYSRSETSDCGTITIEEVWYENGSPKRKKTRKKRIR